MNRKGQMTTGMILVTAITLIVALVIFASAIIPQIGTSTTLSVITNTSLTTVDGTALTELDGVVWTNIIVIDALNGTVLGAGNWTLENKVLSTIDGTLTARVNMSVDPSYSSSVNMSGTVEGDQYISDSGARSVTLMILIFSALAIAVVALEPTLRSGIIEKFGK